MRLIAGRVWVAIHDFEIDGVQYRGGITRVSGEHEHLSQHRHMFTIIEPDRTGDFLEVIPPEEEDR